MSDQPDHQVAIPMEWIDNLIGRVVREAEITQRQQAAVIAQLQARLADQEADQPAD